MRRLLILFFVVCLLSGVSLALASHGGLPSVGWTSGQQIQNIGSGNATINLVAYNSLGYAYNCPSKLLVFGESHTFLSDDEEDVCFSDDFTTPLTIPWGFSGSGVVYSDQPLAGIVNIHNMGFGRAAGQYNATSAGVVATQISFPLVKYDHGNPGRTTTFYIQNAGSVNNTITATFQMAGTPYTTTFRNVKPYTRVILQPGDAVTSTAVTVGSLTVIGSQPLAGISLEHPTDAPVITGMQASRAFVPDDYAETVHCPLLRHEWRGNITTSGLQVQNVGDITTTITVTYNIVEGNGVLTSTVHTRANVAPGESKNFLQSNHLYTDTLASAVVTNSASEIVAVVNDRADGTDPKRFLTYACLSDDNATTKISLPLVKEHFFGSTSGVQVQNTGTISTHMLLTYTTNTNLTFVISTTAPIAAGASKTFYNLTGNGTTGISITFTSPLTNVTPLKKTVSGVIVESKPWNGNSAQPVVAMAVESSVNVANPQDSKAYEGINLD